MDRRNAMSLGVGLGLGALSLRILGGVAGRAQAGSSDEAAIREILARQEAAWNAGDAHAFSAHIAEDCFFTNILGTNFLGKEAFEQQHAMIFRTVYAGSRLGTHIRVLKMLTTDVAIVEAELALSGYKRLPPGVTADPDGVLYTELEEVLVKRKGSWEIVTFHNVDRKPKAAHP